MSCRKASILANAVLEDLGVINSGNSSGIIDKNKLNRQRIKSRLEKTVNATSTINSNNSRGLYFEGKKDNTLTEVVKGGVKRNLKVSVERS